MRLIYLVLPLMAGSFLLSVGVADVQSTLNVLNVNTSSRAPSIAISADSEPEQQAETVAFEESVYSFTIRLPDSTEEKFSRISLTEQGQNSTSQALSFDPAKTAAFLGTPSRRGKAIATTRSWVDETGTIWVEFSPSLAAGTTLTVEFKGESVTPGSSREYGIAAYPDTRRPVAVFVGTGTLNAVEGAY